ncbi:hypothetical protein NDS46_16580 [Paenibacillus thiaminolyticus]|uniref:SdrD B-like domain-containing protein n=1 Tax=Paenibacillus thiaminolyticus TaxID=49283 RepID=UPI00232C5AD2|nr:SdrD B-like domain-containing protein [Paenibacillus thiaminolyticus]WCF05985.1 hypothetical protein NDS46_16580 [Paenibacillus thiaminolyticus]
MTWTKPHQGNDPAKDSDVINEEGYTEDGYYLFDNLSAGTYIVHFELPDGYRFTIKGAGNDPSAIPKPMPTAGPT